MEIVGLGIDCQIANYLKLNNLRNHAYPFDWIVTYTGVTDIIKNKFKDFLISVSDNKVQNIYDCLFLHHNLTTDKNMYERRIDRFNSLLISNKRVMFIRASHYNHHHNEHKIIDDVEDCVELDKYLTETYPLLNFKLICILLCRECYLDVNEINKDNLTVINCVDSDFEKGIESVLKQHQID